MHRMNGPTLKTASSAEELANYLLDQARFPEGAKILEVGCQDGMILAAIARRRPDLHFSGVDQNQGNLTTAKVHLPEGRFALAKLLEQLPLQGPYDRIFSYGIAQQFNSLQFVEWNERLSRCLLPRGTLHHFGIPNARQSFQFTMQKWQNQTGRMLGTVLGGANGIVSKWTHKYNATSYWHDPEVVQGSLQHLGTIQLRIPADTWYHFDVKIIP